ncbi:TPA: SEC10/PgrA surface exclusion domain-containing protein [Streptococcus suis]|nr:SEC10/PgrA surface exclusion domain-containing protein [Streptococcus suis]
MSKSNVTGHGTIKKLRTGAVVSVLTTSMLVGGVVSAEEVVTGTEYTLVEVVAESGASEEVVETKVTDAQVSEAKAEADQATQAVTAQEAVVGGLEETIATGESTVSDLNTQIEEANKVTPEVVADAKTGADAKSDALATANETVETATNSANATAEAVTIQEGVVSDADANAQKTASAVADAEKKVADLSGTTDTTQLQKDVDTLTEAVAKDTTDLAEAKQALESAQLAETNKAQAIATQEGVVASKEADVDSTANALANATKAKSDADKEVSTTKSALDTAKAGTTVTTGTTETPYFKDSVGYAPELSDAYLDAIKALYEGTGTTSGVRSAINSAYTSEETGVSAITLRNYNSTGTRFVEGEFVPYGSEDTDSTVIVDFNNLTTEQSKELSLYAATIINDLRAKLGTSKLAVTDTSVALAVALMQKEQYFYTVNTWSGEKNTTTYTKPLSENLASSETEIGVTGGTSTAVQGKLIPTFSSVDVNNLTMGDLKLLVYQGIVNSLMGSSESTTSPTTYASAFSILGLDGTQNVALGVDLAHEYAQGKPNSFFTTFVFTPVATNITTKTVVDKSAVAAAQSAYDTALDNAQTANVAYQNANTAYVNAQQALADAQKQLSDLKSGTVDIPALEQAVKDAETQLEKDQASLQSAKETLAVAKASAIDKANALSKAKAELVEARSADENAQGVLAQEKETLEVLKKADQVAQLALTEAIAKQSTAKSDSEKATAKYNELAKALTDKGAVLTVLNAKLTEANQALAVARAEYETAKELLATLKVDATEKTTRYEELANLKAEQDRTEAEAKRLAELNAKAETINNAGGIATPVLDANGVVIDYVDGKKATSVVHTKIGKQAGITQVGDKITYSRVERAKTLPNTGEQTSLLALAGVSVLSSLGLASARRRKQG